MTAHEPPAFHDFDPDEASSWDEWRRSLPAGDPLHLPADAKIGLHVAGDVDALGGRVDWYALLEGDRPEQDWLVEPLLARGRAHALYAPAKAGKSLLALEVAAASASGRACLHQPAGPPRCVLYIDLEMTEDDLRERVEALDYGPAELARLHYHLLPPVAPLDTAHGGAAIVAEADRIGADLVVVDTVARSILGAENEADTISNLARYTFTPLKRAGRTSLRVDHSGKDLDKGQRGSSAKNDDVDVVWRLTVADVGSVSLRATHRRLAWVPEHVALTRAADPLRHTLADTVWPAGCSELAAQLDGLELPADCSKRKAREAMKRAGIAAANDLLNAAIKWRRNAMKSGPHDSTARSAGADAAPGSGPVEEIALDLHGPPDGPLRPASAGKSGPPGPSIEGPGPQPHPKPSQPDPDEEF